MYCLLVGRILFYKASLALLMSSNDPRMARGITNSLCNHRPTNYRLSTIVPLERRSSRLKITFLTSMLTEAFNQPFHFRYIDPGNSAPRVFEISFRDPHLRLAECWNVVFRSTTRLKHTRQKLLVESNNNG